MTSERTKLVERLRAIAGLVSTHTMSENDDAKAVGLLRGIAFRLAELDASVGPACDVAGGCSPGLCSSCDGADAWPAKERLGKGTA